jgi:hypothetical protein
LTPDAVELGLAAALPPVFELTRQIGEFGRGERSSADIYQLVVHVDAGDAQPLKLVRSA